MKKQGIRGGFNQETLALLHNNPRLIRQAYPKNTIAEFPRELFQANSRQIELSRSTGKLYGRCAAIEAERNRNNETQDFGKMCFVSTVRQCAICESNIRLQDSLLDLQAAHIMWHAYGGPDKVSNGLATLFIPSPCVRSWSYRVATGQQRLPGDHIERD